VTESDLVVKAARGVPGRTRDPTAHGVAPGSGFCDPAPSVPWTRVKEDHGRHSIRCFCSCDGHAWHAWRWFIFWLRENINGSVSVSQRRHRTMDTDRTSYFVQWGYLAN